MLDLIDYKFEPEEWYENKEIGSEDERDYDAELKDEE